jgi:hypothetical protein
MKNQLNLCKQAVFEMHYFALVFQVYQIIFLGDLPSFKNKKSQTKMLGFLTLF